MNIGESSKLNTNPEDSPESILRLFVYGTLKRGYWNHQRFCAQARSIEPAVVWSYCQIWCFASRIKRRPDRQLSPRHHL